MAINPINRLAGIINHQGNAIGDLQENITPNADDSPLQVTFTDAIELRAELTVTKKVVASNALAFDRPQEGQMFDNTDKQFDIGYDDSQEEILYNVQF
jgi:hypothetical protein